jgi:hypothetical protein
MRAILIALLLGGLLAQPVQAIESIETAEAEAEAGVARFSKTEHQRVRETLLYERSKTLSRDVFRSTPSSASRVASGYSSCGPQLSADGNLRHPESQAFVGQLPSSKSRLLRVSRWVDRHGAEAASHAAPIAPPFKYFDLGNKGLIDAEPSADGFGSLLVVGENSGPATTPWQESWSSAIPLHGELLDTQEHLSMLRRPIKLLPSQAAAP